MALYACIIMASKPLKPDQNPNRYTVGFTHHIVKRFNLK